jgi:hypothetical protein
LFKDEIGYEAACYISAEVMVSKGTYTEMDTGVTESDTSGGRCQATNQLCTDGIPVRAHSICPRASESPNGSRAIRGRYLIVVSKAHREKMSEIGLDPWYAAAHERLHHMRRMSRTYVD